MKLKSLDYIVSHAVNLACSEENAVVCMAFSNYKQAREYFSSYSEIAIPLGMKAFNLSMKFQNESSRLVFLVVTEETLLECGGFQFSHVFVAPDVTWKCQQYLEGKLRSTKKFKTDMGLFTELGVKRIVWSDY